MHFAYDLVRQNLKERTSKQAVANETLSFPSLEPGEQVLTHRPYTENDGPTPKLISPGRGPYISCESKRRPSPIASLYKYGNPAAITVHLGRIKTYYVSLPSPALDVVALDDTFLATTLPVHDLERSLGKVKIGAFTVERIDGQKRGVGAASLINFQYHLKLEGYSTQICIWRHVNAIPQCRDIIASYRAAVLSRDS